MSLLDKIKKTSTIKLTSLIEDSKIFNEKDSTPTPIYGLNIALSGSLDGGFMSGLTLFCGPSKHFKTLYTLILAKAYMDKYPEAVLLFYDSEFGTPISYFTSLNIDMSRVIHTPITNIEEFKFDVMQQLNGLERGEKLFIAVDSVGNLASKKEVDDALSGSDKADMTRAKQFKSVFRMITPFLTIKDIPMVAVNHIYMCGTEDMMIRTENGNISLKDARTGMKVYTTNGLEEIQNVFSYDDALVTDIELEDGTILSFTEGHRFMVEGEWKYVEDLEVGMDLQTENCINNSYVNNNGFDKYELQETLR